MIDLFENDAAVLPYLEKTLSACSEILSACGHTLTYRIHEKDFILDAASSLFSRPSLFDEATAVANYDAVIMNPPYFKLAKDSVYARVMANVVHGQPNIYAFFLAAAAEMLAPGGQLVAITPRSFCNGLYFRDFRSWFFDRMSLERVHLFESRTDTFQDVLQESLVWLSVKDGQSRRITISTSYGKSVETAEIQEIPASAVLDRTGGDLTIRIPANKEETRIVRYLESWPQRFSDTGLRVSTGPVVTFRAREFLLKHPTQEHAAPLLSVHNVKAFRTEWPNYKRQHPTAIKVCDGSERLLLPTRNYVLLRRFSAKEEPRRLTASPLLRTEYPFPFVGLENHLNYIYHADRELTTEETLGLVALFNSSLLDRYFRTISGNTQVNATELRSMKFPGLGILARIGARIITLTHLAGIETELFVLEELGITGTFKRMLLADNLFLINTSRDED